MKLTLKTKSGTGHTVSRVLKRKVRKETLPDEETYVETLGERQETRRKIDGVFAWGTRLIQKLDCGDLARKKLAGRLVLALGLGTRRRCKRSIVVGVVAELQNSVRGGAVFSDRGGAATLLDLNDRR